MRPIVLHNAIEVLLFGGVNESKLCGFVKQVKFIFGAALHGAYLLQRSKSIGEEWRYEFECVWMFGVNRIGSEVGGDVIALCLVVALHFVNFCRHGWTASFCLGKKMVKGPKFGDTPQSLGEPYTSRKCTAWRTGTRVLVWNKFGISVLFDFTVNEMKLSFFGSGGKLLPVIDYGSKTWKCISLTYIFFIGHLKQVLYIFK